MRPKPLHKIIVPNSPIPPGYSPEYLPDGGVWLLKDGKRLRLLPDYRAFLVAALMHGGYANRNTPLLEWPEAPFGWLGDSPQFPPPAKCDPKRRIQFKASWPFFEVSVSIKYAIWRLWVVASKSRHARFIQEFDPVDEYFMGWIEGVRDVEVDRGYVTSGGLRTLIERFKTLLRETDG